MKADHHEHHHEHHEHHHPKFELFVDRVKFMWEHDKISGKQLRELAGIPEDVEIFLEVHGHPDAEIKDSTIVDLKDIKGHAHFSTQAAGSKAG